MSQIAYLQNFLKSTIKNLELVVENGVRREVTFEINCGSLTDYNSVDITKSEEYRQLFNLLRTIHGPVLYWFEIVSNHTSLQVLEAIEQYKYEDNCKATPAIRTFVETESNVLYVGKVKGVFWGRLVQHLGFYKVKATQGLQLFYWAKEMGLNLKVHILEFDDNMADIMPVIEYAFAKRLKPIVGKHK